MDIAEQLRAEIERRGLTPTEVAHGSGVSQQTIYGFYHEGRQLRADKLSAVAEYLGFYLTLSKRRSEEMSKYLDNIAAIEELGHDVTDESVELASNYRADLEWLDRNYGDWDEDDAEKASNYRADLEWLDRNYGGWDDHDVEKAAEFVAYLRYIESLGESLDDDRIAEVAEYAANLREMND